MPKRSISPASTVDQNGEYLRKEPDHAATPPPPPPPPQKTSTPHWRALYPPWTPSSTSNPSNETSKRTT